MGRWRGKGKANLFMSPSSDQNMNDWSEVQVGGQRDAIADALWCALMTKDQKDGRDRHGSVVIRRQFISSKPENIFLVLVPLGWSKWGFTIQSMGGQWEKKWGMRNERRRDKTTKWGMETLSGWWNASHCLFVRNTQRERCGERRERGWWSWSLKAMMWYSYCYL